MACRSRKEALVMNKNDFVLFMEAVINCTTQTDKKTEKNPNNCEDYRQTPGNHGSVWETAQEMLSGRNPSSQPGGGSSLWS